MYDVNFLTPEYKERLKSRSKIKKYMFLIGMILIFFTGIYGGLSAWNSAVERDIAMEQEKISIKEEKIAKLEKEMSEIPDLTDKIKVIEDIFNDEGLRVSTILNSLEEIAPLNIWFDSLTYDNGKILISGTSYNNPNLGLESEKNLYEFEKKLIESELYKDINHEFTKTSKKNGIEINSFKFNLNLK